MQEISKIMHLNNIKKAQDFVKLAEEFESDIDARQGRYLIDAKSIMGIFSLDLTNPIEVLISTDSQYELVKFNEFSQFEYKD